MNTTNIDNMLNEEIQRRLNNDAENIQYMRFIRQRKAQRRRLALIAGALFIPLIVFFVYHWWTKSIFESTSSTLFLGLGALVSIAAAALTYLQPSAGPNENPKSSYNFNELKFYIDKRFGELKDVQSDAQSPLKQFTDSDKARILESIQAKLESDALQAYMAGIKNLASASVKKESLETHFKNITARLTREVENLAKRGNLNLILGILTTLIGLTVLGYSVFYSPPSHSPQELVTYFIPRVSLVVLIEVFAYFFLRLYKQSLSEIKYFQNEITNIESKQLAVSIITNNNDSSLITRVVENLSNTERNFTINKDQTTIDLERERIASQNHTNLISTIKDLINRKGN